MQNSLPNELIREFLLPVLDVPDEMFQSIYRVSPFSRPDHLSTSSVLCVCRSWMNVGTPLLYRVVVLRSKAQANALQRTLRKHPTYGAYVKKLRVEGGYGSTMRTILTSAPNITDLCIYLSIESSDCVSGLCGSLPSINPSRVVARFTYARRSTQIAANLAQELYACFRTWTNMVSQIFPTFLDYTEFTQTICWIRPRLPWLAAISTRHSSH